MTPRLFLLTCLISGLFALMVPFLWVQTGLPVGQITPDPWGVQIQGFASLFAGWIPLIYLFFTSLWMYLERQLADVPPRLRSFLKLDIWSYGFLLLFLLFQMTWKEVGHPEIWLRVGVLLLMLFKSLILLRALYTVPQLIQPALLIVLNVGWYLLSFPLLHLPFTVSLPDLLQPDRLLQIAEGGVKAVGLSLMAVEVYRLSSTMTQTKQSAFLSWLIVSFTFPVLGFPQLSSILAGLLIIFILRLVISRLDTRELTLGLLQPTSMTVGIKFLVVLLILGSSGLIFWGNVRPGFDIHLTRAVETAFGALFDAQFGLFGYAPVYWISLIGMGYLLFSHIWDGVLLLVIGVLLYSGYHLAVYGILGHRSSPDDMLPFVPFLAVFIAIAHQQFGKISLFRLWLRLTILATVAVTSLLLLISPAFTLPSRLAAIQRQIMHSLNKDISILFPSMRFQVVSWQTVCWVGVVVVLTLLCSQSKTRIKSDSPSTLPNLNASASFRHLPFYPILLSMLLCAGILLIAFINDFHPLPLDASLQLSPQAEKYTLPLEGAALPPSKGLLLVSNVTGGAHLHHTTPLVSVTITGQDKYFETFTMKVGHDTAEEMLEKPGLRQSIDHGRAAIYRSWTLTDEQGLAFDAHEYYTKFFFKKPLTIQKITLKFLSPQSSEYLLSPIVHIKQLVCIH
ncbi:hypothetical protein GF339_22600 [candidate division KSB3 bacterium]|uniref:Uncharacterized protein n=1 Tax=candidate division KSB3 bacterium TaxID=2044937 RepID=A0A9D5K014_9BACT|nr:hypothetical protein [candidate division KSB3 bacterium]MBD3327394.1 hypothetical protein [candidate division KSB3 bacterium]